MTRGYNANVSHKQGGYSSRAEDADVGRTAITAELVAVEAVRSGGGGGSMRGGGGYSSETFEITRREIGGKTQLGNARTSRHRGGGLHDVSECFLVSLVLFLSNFLLRRMGRERKH